MRRSIIGLAVACLGWAAAGSAPAAGIAFIDVPADPAQPSAAPAMQGAVWYPCATAPGIVMAGQSPLRGVKDCKLEGHDLPLVVISHGFNGWFGSHQDTAEALADAGYVVAAISHPADSGHATDETRKPPLPALIERPDDIKRLIDFMLGSWQGAPKIDSARIGFFGFSRGGFTGLALIGGNSDFQTAFDALCLGAAPAPGCQEVREHGLPTQALTHDPRIKAAVIADPFFGRFYDLGAVRAPVQLWASQFGGDGVLPDDGSMAAGHLPTKPEFQIVDGAGHFVFLPPCRAQTAQANPQICTDAPGFDRAAFHARLNREVTTFFMTYLVSHP